MIDSRVLLHPKTGEPIVPLGYRKDGRAIWPILGASEDDGKDDDAEDGKDDGDDDGKDDDAEDDPWKDLKPEEMRAARTKIVASNTRAKAQAKAWREYAQGKTDTAPDGAKREKPDDDADDDVKPDPKDKNGKGTLTPAQARAATRAAEKAAREDERGTLMDVLITTAAGSALQAAGWKAPKDSGKREAAVERMVKLLDRDDISLDGKKLVGLDDAVESLKADFPELFGKAVVTTPKPGNQGGGRGGGGTAKSVTELQAEAMFGGGS